MANLIDFLKKEIVFSISVILAFISWLFETNKVYIAELIEYSEI